MQTILNFLKSLLGKNLTKKIRPFGHGLKAYLASLVYGFPGHKITLIGITGTKGKTTTTVLTGKILNLLGKQAGFISSALIFDGKKEVLNPFKMGTIDSFKMQKYLAEMVKNGCQFAVLEMTSLGLEQHRHYGLGKFDSTVFLNIYPEHIEAHGSWENYLKAKGILFKNLAEGGKFIANFNQDQEKNSLFMQSQIPASVLNSVKKIKILNSDFEVLNYEFKLEKGLKINNKVYLTNFISEVEIVDAIYAIKTIENYFPEINSKLDLIFSHLKGIPGRMEWVVKNGEIINSETTPKPLASPLDRGILASDHSNISVAAKLASHNYNDSQNSALLPISILVDYAHEPESMRKLLQTLQTWKKEDFFTKIIHILSCDGAGRDDWKKPVLGDLSYQYSDYTFLTTDNYEEDDDPEEILKLLSQNYDKNLLNQKYFQQINRKKTFEDALTFAKTLIEKDPLDKHNPTKILIVSTGVGTEAGLTQPEGKIKWDEREVWREVYKQS